jgi:hypothetical protein
MERRSPPLSTRLDDLPLNESIESWLVQPNHAPAPSCSLCSSNSDVRFTSTMRANILMLGIGCLALVACRKATKQDLIGSWQVDYSNFQT